MSHFTDKPEIEVSTLDIEDSVIDKINSLDLRSDLENGNIHGCILRTVGYVGNRPSDCTDDEHEDDTWAIDIVSEDGSPETSYLYTSEFEYNQDYELLKKYA